MNENDYQTEVDDKWKNKFQHHKTMLSQDKTWFNQELQNRIRQKYLQEVGEIALTQGLSNILRDLIPVFQTSLPAKVGQCIHVWVCNGWETEEKYLRNEAIQFGNQSPIIVVFIPKSPSLQLRRYLTEYKAAADTISGYGLIFESADDIASENMTKIRDIAEEKVDLLLDTAFSNSFVLKSDGKEVKGITMQESVSLAAEEALQRLYPQFSLADNIGWSEVYERASRGTPNALKAVSYEGKPENNPVCKAIIDFITVGKMGSEIQDKFQSPPYGWPIDAVDGGLQVLLAAELARAIDERNRTFDPRSLDRKDLSKSLFKLESATVSNSQRDQICSLMDKVGINSEVGKELFHLSLFLDKLDDLVVQAGGDPPRPIRPVSSLLEKIRGKSGNESLLILFENREELGESIDEWQCLTKGINKRLPNWNKLKTLADQASMLDDTEEILSQVKAIQDQRKLLNEPDLIRPLMDKLSQLLRIKLKKLMEDEDQHREAGLKRLNEDSNWEDLAQEQKYQLLKEEKLDNANRLKERINSSSDDLDILKADSLSLLINRIDDLPKRFDRVAERAAEIIEDDI